MSVSSIISCVSNEMDSFGSLYGICSGVYVDHNASGEVVNMTEGWGSWKATGPHEYDDGRVH